MNGTSWDLRETPQAASPEKLAALVASALRGADALLFTATPREELDEIGRFQQLRDQAWAGQVRAIVAAYNRATDAEREFACDEVALALGVSPTLGGRLLHEALACAALPGLVEAVSAGVLTERHALAVLRELDAVQLTVEQRHCVVLIALARYAGETPGLLGKTVARLILTVDRAAAQARRDLATRARRVAFYHDVDGQAVLHARGPIEAIAAIKAALDATLSEADTAARADGTHAGDERCAAEREFDLLVALLTDTTEVSGWHAHVVVPFHTAAGGDTELADIPGFGPILPSTAHDLLDGALTLAPVNIDTNGMPFSAGDPITVGAPAGNPLAAQEPTAPPAPTQDTPTQDTPTQDTPAQGAPARESAARPEPAVQRVDPMRVALLAMATHPAPVGHVRGGNTGVAGYRVPTRVQRYLQARDQTCVFPGCTRPASATDADHRLAWPAGPTHASNLHCLCRHHHRAKQVSFSPALNPSGDTEWTTRGGWVFTRRRQDY